MSDSNRIEPADFCRSVANAVQLWADNTGTDADIAEDAVNAAFLGHGVLDTTDCENWEDLAIIGAQHALDLLAKLRAAR